ncbi:hypothetical protein PAMP_019439 [Pampus punctatissimus]
MDTFNRVAFRKKPHRLESVEPKEGDRAYREGREERGEGEVFTKAVDFNFFTSPCLSHWTQPPLRAADS